MIQNFGGGGFNFECVLNEQPQKQVEIAISKPLASCKHCDCALGTLSYSSLRSLCKASQTYRINSAIADTKIRKEYLSCVELSRCKKPKCHTKLVVCRNGIEHCCVLHCYERFHLLQKFVK